jgi:hypothetical protein
MIPDVFGFCWQGHVDKAIVVIKNKEDEPLERFVFALRTMVEVQGYDRDRRFVSWYTGRSQLILGPAASKTLSPLRCWDSTLDRSCRD